MRRFMIAGCAVLLTVAAACGGDDGDENENGPTATPQDRQSVGVGTATPEAPPPPKPSPITEGLAQALEVSTLQKTVTFTFDEFKALPKAQITVNGKTYSGVSLATLASGIEAAPTALVTVQGYRPDWRRLQFIRYPSVDVGAETVLFIDPEGYISVASTKINDAEWLKSVVSVSFP